MDVGVRELKQHLSEYLDRVERGETIRVTDRGRPKALITGLGAADPLAHGVEHGWIRPPVAASGLEPYQPKRSDRRVRDVLDDDRGDD